MKLIFDCTILPVYTRVVKEVEGIRLRVNGAVVSNHLHDSSLGYAGLQQGVIYGDGNAILATKVQI